MRNRSFNSLLLFALLGSALHAGCGGDSSSSDGSSPGGLTSSMGAGGANAGKGGASGKGGGTGGVGGGSGKGGASTAGGSGASGVAGAAGAGSSGKAGASGAGAAGQAGAGGSSGKSGGSGSGGSGAQGGSASAGAAGSGAAGSGAAGSGGSGGAAVDPVVSVMVEPYSPIIVIEDGVIPPAINFTAKAVKQSGAEAPIKGTWAFDALDIGTIDAGSGAFNATGLHGGDGTVTFDAGGGLKGDSPVTIKLKLTYDPDGQPASVKDAFANPTGGPDGAIDIVYPYDQTVFPRGLSGPEIQWNGGGGGDIYRLHAVSDTFELDSYFSAPPPSRFAFPEVPVDLWKKLTTSVSGQIQIELQRYDGAKAYEAKKQTWRIASANLAGTIYYTALDPAKGDVLRLSPGAKAPESFLQTNGRCIACHTVSSNGKRLVAGFDGGWSPWGVFDAASGALLFDSGQASGFEAMSPDGELVLWRHWSDGSFNSENTLRLSAYDNNNVLATLQTDGSHAPAHPVWSHDGSKIALANRLNGNGLDFTQSKLWLANVTTSPPQFSDVKQIVDNDPGRPTVTFPSFTPDSKWIAFMRATQARTQNAQGEVWLTDGNGTTVPLDALNGTGYLSGNGGDANRSFEPSFLPLAAGGYFWVVFSSTRAYGNYAATGTALQLWVAAIEQNPQPGKDPSHPAFRLPGQNLGVRNMRGQWARAVCKPLGASCEAGFDCCDGFCLKNDQGEPVCSGKPVGCVGVGNACAAKSDCCGTDFECINGFCSEGKP